jgi:hypothetical protein
MNKIKLTFAVLVGLAAASSAAFAAPRAVALSHGDVINECRSAMNPVDGNLALDEGRDWQAVPACVDRVQRGGPVISSGAAPNFY